MKKYSQKLLWSFVACLFLLGQNSFAEDLDESWAQIVAEGVYRPAGVLLTLGGSALFVAVLPFSLITGSTKHTAKTLVQKPFDFTFRRPVGTSPLDWEDIQ